MKYPYNVSRAGIFDNNVFQRELKSINEIELYRKELTQECIDEIEKCLERKQKYQAPLTAL